MSGYELEEKATGFADEFDMEGNRGKVEIFPFSLTFHWVPRPAKQFAGASAKRKSGTQNKSVGLLFQLLLKGGQAQLSDSAVATILQGSPPLLSLQKQARGQCGDVWWSGPPLLQGRAQLDTSVPN